MQEKSHHIAEQQMWQYLVEMKELQWTERQIDKQAYRLELKYASCNKSLRNGIVEEKHNKFHLGVQI
jgi:hypothetical protein